MGQYHRVVNLDKKQFLSPHSMGLGAKLLEFGESRLSACLIYLLAVSNGRGGGDLTTESEVIGSWGGDRIAVVGDYWEDDDRIKVQKEQGQKQFIPTWDNMDGTDFDEDGKGEYTDISVDVLSIVCEADDWFRSSLLEDVARYDFDKDWSEIFAKEEIKAEQNKQEEARANNSN